MQFVPQQGLICYELKMKSSLHPGCAVALLEVATFPLFNYVASCEYGNRGSAIVSQ